MVHFPSRKETCYSIAFYRRLSQNSSFLLCFISFAAVNKQNGYASQFANYHFNCETFDSYMPSFDRMIDSDVQYPCTVIDARPWYVIFAKGLVKQSAHNFRHVSLFSPCCQLQFENFWTYAAEGKFCRIRLRLHVWKVGSSIKVKGQIKKISIRILKLAGLIRLKLSLVFLLLVGFKHVSPPRIYLKQKQKNPFSQY